MTILLVFETMLTLFLLCAAGYIGRKAGIIDTDFSKKLSNFVIKTAQPFLILNAILGTEYSRENLALGFYTLLLGLVCHAALAVCGALYSKHIKPINEAKMTNYCIIFSNAGFIGLPVIGAILGEKGLFCGAFYQISFNLFVWSYGMYMLGRGREDIKMNPKKMIINPGTPACIIGMILYLLKPYFILPDFLTSAFSYLGSLCTPLTQIIIGGLLATRSIVPLLKSAKLYVFTFVKLILIPCIAALICRVLGADEFFTLFTVTMVALPCAANATMFGELYDIEPEYAAQLVGVTTVMSVLTIPAVLYVTNFIMNI